MLLDTEKWEHATPAYEDETEPYSTGTVEDYEDWLEPATPPASEQVRVEHVRPGDRLAGLLVTGHDPNVDGYVEIVTEDGRERFFRRGSLVAIEPARKEIHA